MIQKLLWSIQNCKIIDEYNPGKKHKRLKSTIVFDDMIVDMINNKKTKFNSD